MTSSETPNEAMALEKTFEIATWQADELLRQYPPYEGPKECERTLEQRAAYTIRRLVKLLAQREV